MPLLKLSLAFTTVLLFLLSCAHGSSWEDSFVTIPNRARAYEHLAYYTSSPHVAGTIEDYETALYTKRKFEEFGLSAHLDTVDTLLTWPLSRQVEIVDPPASRFKAGLQEDPVSVDPTTSDSRIVPTFNAYSPSGDVTAEVVYVNYGGVEDYRALEALGVTVQGKIVIARYGGIFRGTKAMIAQEKGAVGILIYSDPQDDGYVKGLTYPEGPWRTETSVQRGSAQFISICPGDPRRDVCAEDKTGFNYTQVIPKIPVQPISWGDAFPFLAGLRGHAAPEKFQGGLNFTYHVGPGPVVAHIKLEMEFKVTPIWNVIATIPADPESPEKDKILLMGNHRDAWTFGAVDPNSGTTALLEIARGYGLLLKQGWKPKRTIMLCSWDGEEYGLLGSTAFAEANAEKFTHSAVAYINVDSGVSGSLFSASSTPSLASFLINATRSVIDPDTKKSLYDVWNKNVDVLGSGSDYTAYLDHLGIASMDFRFQGSYGVYHSAYDSQHWMNDFGAPTYEYYVLLAQLWGTIGIRLADAQLLPYNYTNYAVHLQHFLLETHKLLEQENGTTYVDLSSVKEAISIFTSAAQKQESGALITDVANANDKLMKTEREFLGPGLPKRPYFQHVIQAPGLYLGYGADTFPGVKQSIRDKDWKQAQQQAAVLATRIEAAAKTLSSAFL